MRDNNINRLEGMRCIKPKNKMAFSITYNCNSKSKNVYGKKKKSEIYYSKIESNLSSIC